MTCRRRTPIPAIALVVCALSACGGSGGSGGSTTSHTDSAAAFKPAYQATTARFKQVSHDIAVAIQGASSRTDAQLATTFSGLARRWRDVTSALSTLKPPASVASQFNALDGAATRAGSDLAAVSSAAAAHSSSAAQKSAGTLLQDVVAARSAAQAIDKSLGLPQ